ncbi:MAG: HPr(Ser) kinase/phosphatase [Elusimicrobiota bacterium]
MAVIAKGLSIRSFLEEVGESLRVRLVSGVRSAGRKMVVAEVNRPGLSLAGYIRHFRAERVQIIGRGEHGYLAEADPRQVRRHLRRMLAHPELPCLIVTNNNRPAPILARVCRELGVPLLVTELDTATFVGELTAYLDEELAPSTTIHGVLLGVYGTGVLIQGEPGIGKSECALELLKRDHILVSDDVVEVRHKRQGVLVGACPETLRHFLEVRGIGIIDVKLMFGIGSVLNETRIELAVHLESVESSRPVDRLGLETWKCKILDVDIPEVRIPVRPGRNLAVLVEVAALNQRLRSQGIVAARTLDERLLQRMQRGGTKAQ